MSATPRNCDRCLKDSSNTTTVCFDRKSKKSFIMCENCLLELAQNAAPTERLYSYPRVVSK